MAWGVKRKIYPRSWCCPTRAACRRAAAVNWGAGFLPAIHQGTAMETAAGPTSHRGSLSARRTTPISGPSGRPPDAIFCIRSIPSTAPSVRATGELEARIAAYELAARLQLSAPEVTDLSGESAATRQLYQLDHPDIGPFGRQCLMGRRLVERGVRFVQIFCGAENMVPQGKPRPNWDSHEDLVRDHGYWGPILDGGASALLTDLKPAACSTRRW